MTSQIHNLSGHVVNPPLTSVTIITSVSDLHVGFQFRQILISPSQKYSGEQFCLFLETLFVLFYWIRKANLAITYSIYLTQSINLWAHRRNVITPHVTLHESHTADHRLPTCIMSAYIGFTQICKHNFYINIIGIDSFKCRLQTMSFGQFWYKRLFTMSTQAKENIAKLVRVN